MTLDETIIALVKSVAKVVLNSRNYNGLKESEVANINEIELYGTIYAVNSRLGLDLPEYNFDDIQNWSDINIGLFKTNLQKIRSVSKQLISNVESSIEYAIRNLNREKSKENESEKSEETESKEEVKEEKPKKSRKKQSESEGQ